MQEKKNKQRLLSLIVLSIVTMLVYLFSLDDEQLKVDKQLFQVEDQTKIDGVVLQSNRGKVEITYDGTAWKVNKKFMADRQLVKVLFATLLQVVPKREVGESVKDSISSAIKKSGTQVSLYEGSELIKSFYAGANVDRTQTYFQLEDNQPYLVTIPGYRVDASQVFELDESGWRDKRVFNFNWRNLKNISVSYPKDKALDFNIDLKQKLLIIQEIEITDTTRLSNFVDDLYTLAGDQLVKKGTSASTDSLFNQSVNFQISITDIANRNYLLKVLQWKSGQSQIPAILNDSLLMLFNKNKIFRITKTKGYFKKRNSAD